MSRRGPYQDKWRDGKLVKKGRRDCAGRFNILQGVIHGEFGSFPPPLVEEFTVLDVGAWDCYFSRRLVEHGVRATAVDGRHPPDLDGYDRLEYIQGKVTGGNVWDLERHSLALALAVFHHMPDWPEVFHGLRARSDVLVAEVAVPDEAGPGRRLTPTLQATRPQIGPSYEELIRVGDLVAMVEGPNGFERPILVVPNTWVGTVEDGSGRAAPYMSDPALDEGHWEELGYQPHPGTLNVHVGKAGRAWAARLPGGQGRSTEKLPGPYWPVWVSTPVGPEHPAHVRLSRSKTAVELVAPQRLRDGLGVDNGDAVVLRVR